MMGEYANDQIRADMKRMFGFDPGDLNEEEKPRKFVRPVYKRVQCPHCESTPKERGLNDHIRAVHPWAETVGASPAAKSEEKPGKS